MHLIARNYSVAYIFFGFIFSEADILLKYSLLLYIQRIRTEYTETLAGKENGYFFTPFKAPINFMIGSVRKSLLMMTLTDLEYCHFD